MRIERAFVTRDIVGFRAFGWQYDWRRGHWLPFSVRNGHQHWHVLHLGRFGMLTAAPMRGKPKL